jgi:hypothetical protein
VPDKPGKGARVLNVLKETQLDFFPVDSAALKKAAKNAKWKVVVHEMQSPERPQHRSLRAYGLPRRTDHARRSFVGRLFVRRGGAVVAVPPQRCDTPCLEELNHTLEPNVLLNVSVGVSGRLWPGFDVEPLLIREGDALRSRAARSLRARFKTPSEAL